MSHSSDSGFDDDVLERLDEIDRHHWPELQLGLARAAGTTGAASPTRSDSVDSEILLILDRIDPVSANETAPLVSQNSARPATLAEALSDNVDQSQSTNPTTADNHTRSSKRAHHTTSMTPSSSPPQRFIKRRRTIHKPRSSSPTGPGGVDMVLNDIAEQSGDDTSAGADDDDNELFQEDEEDREFITEASSHSASDYDQTAVYHQSLLMRNSRKRFVAFDGERVGRGTYTSLRGDRTRAEQQSTVIPQTSGKVSPTQERDENGYELGSFVVEDGHLSPASSINDLL